MNPGTMPARNDFQELCSLGFDRALGIEKASLATVVRLNEYVIDFYKSDFHGIDFFKNAKWFSPLAGGCFETAARTLTFCTKWQMYWLTLMTPLPLSRIMGVGNNAENVAEDAVAQPAEEEFAFSMDIALGERFTLPDSVTGSGSGGHFQPPAEAQQSAPPLAFGAHAGS